MLIDSDDPVGPPNETIQTNFYRHVRLTSRDNNKLFGVDARALRWAFRAGSSQFTLNEYTLYLSHKKQKKSKPSCYLTKTSTNQMI